MCTCGSVKNKHFEQHIGIPTIYYLYLQRTKYIYIYIYTYSIYRYILVVMLYND